MQRELSPVPIVLAAVGLVGAAVTQHGMTPALKVVCGLCAVAALLHLVASWARSSGRVSGEVGQQRK